MTGKRYSKSKYMSSRRSASSSTFGGRKSGGFRKSRFGGGGSYRRGFGSRSGGFRFGK